MAKTWYISHKGNDLHDGQNENAPLRTMAGVNAKGFAHGDTLLFDGSGTFNESIELHGMRDVSLGAYGAGQPLILPGGRKGLTVAQCENVRVSGLKFQGMGWKVCNDSAGVFVHESKRVRLENLECAGFHRAGIRIAISEYVDVLGCFAHDNGSVGIATGGEYGEGTRRSRHIYIAHCKANDNAGDFTTKTNHSGSGIVLAGTHHGVVEYCEAAGNGWGQRQRNHNGPVGMWSCCGCDNVVFRYCISRHNRTQPSTVDGDGFDIDGETANGTVEYCYSYGNEGAGYLHCEFSGKVAEKNWRNNKNFACLSIADDTRVGGYGALTIYTPSDVPMDEMFIERNLFVARGGESAVSNLVSLPPHVTDMRITDNVLVTGGAQAIKNVDYPAFKIENNAEITDAQTQAGIIAAAPYLTDPRILPELPVFDMLVNNSCAEIVRKGEYAALFGTHARTGESEKPITGKRLFELRLYDMDLEGCDYSGDVRLTYDSIRPGVVTRLTGMGAQVHFPFSSFNPETKYLVRVTARLTSPDVIAYTFLRNADGTFVRKVYLHGNASGYHTAQIPWPGDKTADLYNGAFVGVCVESGAGAVMVYSIEAFATKTEAANNPFSSLDAFRQYGDVYTDGEGTYVLNNPGAALAANVQIHTGTVNFEYMNDGTAVINTGDGKRELPYAETWQNFSVPLVPKNNGCVELAIWQRTGTQLRVRNVQVE